MTPVLVVAGVTLAGLALRDILHELFHPGGSGTISRQIMRAVWRLFRWIGARRPSALPLAGPVTLVTVLICWALMLAVGWALVYWPFLPDAFRLASPLTPSTQDGFDDALYVSLVSLSTLGFGDVTPIPAWLRIVATVEGLVGFALLTAGISWILMLYPVLTRRRAFASRVLVLDEARRRTSVSIAGREPTDAARLLDDLTAQLTVLRADLMLSPISYYFHDNDPSVALSRALPLVLRTAGTFDQSGSASARHAAAALAGAADAFAALVAAAHLGMAGQPTGAILTAYQREHPHRQREE